MSEKRIIDPVEHPPRVGDFVKGADGVMRRVKQVTEKRGDHEVEYEDGGFARWKRDKIIIVSRDEGRDKKTGELVSRYGLM